MAKKQRTRQEKKIAQLRRELETQKRKAEIISPLKDSPRSSPKQTEISVQKSHLQMDSPHNGLDKKEIGKDLLKTAILSGLAISLELVIYMVVRQA